MWGKSDLASRVCHIGRVRAPALSQVGSLIFLTINRGISVRCQASKSFLPKRNFCKILILYRVLDTERNWYDKEAVPEGRYENLPLSMTRERNELFSLRRAIDILQRNPTKRIGLEFKSQLLILDFREDIESEE